MKIIELYQDDQAEAKRAGLGRALGKINLPLGHPSQGVEDAVLQVLQNRLDHRFVCLRNFYLPDIYPPPAFILIGPQGITLLRISMLKGIFRAAGESWEELDTRSKKFSPAKINLLLETQRMADMLDTELSRKHPDLPKTEAVIYFPNPGAHVDTEQPVIRILLADALDRFLSGILTKASIAGNGCDRKNYAMRCSKREFCATSNDARTDKGDIFSLHEPQKKKSPKATLFPKPALKEPGVLKTLQFSKRQWVFLGLMIFVNIIILVALVMVILVLT